MRRCFFLAAWVVLACFCQVYGITVDQAVDSALKNNISIKKSEFELDNSIRNKNTSWNSISPSLSANGSWSKAVPEKDGSRENMSAGVSLRTTFGTNLFTNIKSASAAYEQQQLTYDMAVRTVELNVRKAYWNILFNKERIRLQEQNLLMARNQYEKNLAKYQRGVLNRVDVLSAQISMQSAELTLETLKTDFESLVANFALTCGFDQGEPLEFDGDFEDIIGGTRIDAKLDEFDSPGGKKIEKQLEVARVALTAQRFSNYSPSVTAGYSYTYSSNDGGENWNDGGTLSLSATIPLDGLMPWSTGSNSLHKTKNTVESLELELENEKRATEISKVSSMNRIQQCRTNIAVLKSSVELAQTNYDMTLEAYNHGTRDLLTLENSQTGLLSSKVNLYSECYNLVCAVLDLENLVGADFGTLLIYGGEN